MLHPQRKTMDLVPLVCLCLLTWSAGTAADHSPPVIKLVVMEGSDAILPCSLGTSSIKEELFDWKRDRQEVFLYDTRDEYNNGRPGQDPQFKGRVFHFPEAVQLGNASIVIRNTQVSDSGNYTCDFPRHQPQRRSRIELLIGPILRNRYPGVKGAAPEPSVTILHQTNDGMVLQCEVKGASPKPKVEWKDRAGNILPAEEPQVSDRGGLYYVTLNITVTKTDRYRCVVTQEEIHHQTHSQIFVPLNGAASKPYVTTVKAKDGVLLQCKVEGASPQPKVEWKDSAGNILPAEEPQVTERGGSYDVILQTPLTKTDTFTCVVTQEDNIHQISADIYVGPFNAATGLVVGVSVPIVLLVVGFVLVETEL